ncbi:MAG: hypothetical protein KGM44_03980 [bacterium]|nr:hypothetical protein [bacterium]
MHDAISLEELGLPTAVIVTEAFVHEAHMQRAALGMEGLDPVSIVHPLSTLTDAQIHDRALDAAAQARRRLMG